MPGLSIIAEKFGDATGGSSGARAFSRHPETASIEMSKKRFICVTAAELPVDVQMDLESIGKEIQQRITKARKHESREENVKNAAFPDSVISLSRFRTFVILFMITFRIGS
jgi:hypothetical protein